MFEKVFIKCMTALGEVSYVVACIYAYLESKYTKKDRLEKLGVRKW